MTSTTIAPAYAETVYVSEYAAITRYPVGTAGDNLVELVVLSTHEDIDPGDYDDLVSEYVDEGMSFLDGWCEDETTLVTVFGEVSQ